MNTELSFLVELLLNHKLAKPTKDLIALRIKGIADHAHAPRTVIGNMVRETPVPIYANPTGVPQSASTLALMAKHAAAGLPPVGQAPVEHVALAAVPEPSQPTIIAHTPAAAAALNDRNAAISAALSGKPEKGRTSPRKF